MQISLQSPYANFQCKVQSKRIQKLKFKQILFEKYDARYLSHMPKSYSKACQDITNDKLHSPIRDPLLSKSIKFLYVRPIYVNVL